MNMFYNNPLFNGISYNDYKDDTASFVLEEADMKLYKGNYLNTEENAVEITDKVPNSKKKIDAARNKSMSEMVKLIASSLNGSGFSDSENFKVDVFKNESSYCVVLSPLKKNMKNFMSEMAVFLNQNYLAESIEMTDANGDITIITISSCKINTDIPSEVFSIE